MDHPFRGRAAEGGEFAFPGSKILGAALSASLATYPEVYALPVLAKRTIKSQNEKDEKDNLEEAKMKVYLKDFYDAVFDLLRSRMEKASEECIAKLNTYNDEVRRNLEATTDWLREHAFSKSYGLGQFSLFIMF
ncbi:hypothetical protein OESDEN_13719 [Oesophagostomum dentatum]|uniref:Uncharacterized protein n=1 Tax=Oesophagostomum dentatum TaxID=61180 RepID=A0A0B1STI7_OESDE|nr:hypothetical protein OESDEN_13719 [Oesophagostomum dentatum]